VTAERSRPAGRFGPPPPTPQGDALTDLLRQVRLGIEGGLDPMAAAQRAAGDFPHAVTGTMERLLRRLRGDYREDRWGFDEDFAEAVFPLF